MNIAVASSAPSTDSEVDSHFHAWLAKDPYMLIHKAISFISVGANSTYYPFAVMYMTSIGISEVEIGMILACASFFPGIVTPFSSRFADQSEVHRRGMLIGSWAIALLGAFGMSTASSFWEVLFSHLAIDTSLTVVSPLIDSTIHACLKVSGGDSALSYGNTRAFGAIGQAMGSWLSGKLIDKRGLHGMFPLFMSLLATLPFLGFFVPLERRGAVQNTARSTMMRLAKPSLFLFMITILCLAVCIFAINLLKSVFLESLGASNELIGLSQSIGSLSEVPFFFMSTFVMRRAPTFTILVIVCVSYALRFSIYGVLQDPRLALPVELLQGFQFSICWTVVSTYVASIVPPQLSATAQGVLGAFMWGIGPGVGALILESAIRPIWGIRGSFWACALIAAISVVPLFVSRFVFGDDFTKKEHESAEFDLEDVVLERVAPSITEEDDDELDEEEALLVSPSNENKITESTTLKENTAAAIGDALTASLH